MCLLFLSRDNKFDETYIKCITNVGFQNGLVKFVGQKMNELIVDFTNGFYALVVDNLVQFSHILILAETESFFYKRGDTIVSPK